MEIAFNNFSREFEQHQNEIESAIRRVLSSGWYILGKELSSFEKQFAAYIGTRYCVGVANGTEAIALALMAVGVGEGDEVITTAMTAYPTITGIEQAGATPVVVDINPSTGLIDVASIEAKVNSRTKAIVPVHIYGQAADMTNIVALARSKKLLIVEDCAQSCGAMHANKMTGSFGIANAFSFYPTKNLGAVGDGGAITTNNNTVYEKLLKLRNYGQNTRYYHDQRGINSRLDEIQAAILGTKLRHLDTWIKRRREIAAKYNAMIRTAKPVLEEQNNFHTYHLYVLRHPQREALMEWLNSKGIATIIHYPVPIPHQKAFTSQKKELFPNTEQFTKEIFSIPIHPFLTEREVDYIIHSINSFQATK